MSTLAERRLRNIQIISQSLPCSDPSSYIIEARDYKRNNSDERHYRAKWLLTLLRVYDCRCGLCGADQDGLELDHFWLPKAKGGNFMLRHAISRNIINNAVPLCVGCNRSKGEKTIELASEQAVRLADANRRMTAAISDASVESAANGLCGFEPGDEYRDGELGQFDSDLKRAMRSHRSQRSQESESVLRGLVDAYLMKSRQRSLSLTSVDSLMRNLGLL